MREPPSSFPAMGARGFEYWMRRAECACYEPLYLAVIAGISGAAAGTAFQATPQVCGFSEPSDNLARM